MLKKAWNFLSSMRFAVILLLVLIAACAAGSFVTQGQTLAWYTQTYSERTAALIMALHLDDVFHSLWFIVLTAFLCLNLLLCNVLRLPSLIRKWKSAGSARTVRAHRAEAAGRGEKDPDGLFQRLGFRHVEKDGDFRFGIKNRAGIWGAWVCHLGILLVILGFGLGQSFKEEYTVYGVPGQSRQIGDTSYILTIDAFDVDLREDETVRQYAADITVRNASDGTSASGTAAVNAPLTMFGMKFYQNSTGWACDMKVEKDGEEIQKETVCAGDYLAIKDKPDLLVLFNVFYPDYVMDPENGPMTASSELKNPAYLYSAYYQGRMLGMNALTGDEVLTIDEYTITFVDEDGVIYTSKGQQNDIGTYAFDYHSIEGADISIKDLDETAFVMGNIAPDSGVPNENWTEFYPPKVVSHFKTKADDETFFDVEEFCNKYFNKELIKSYSKKEYSFFLGYYVHLLTDIDWSL